MATHDDKPLSPGPADPAPAALPRPSLRADRREPSCQRFLPSWSPSKTAVRAYLASRLPRDVIAPRAPAPAAVHPAAVHPAAAHPAAAPTLVVSPTIPQSDPLPDVARAPGGLLRRRDGGPRDNADLTSAGAAPPDLSPPLGWPTWSTEPAQLSERRFGSHSHAGPVEVEADKGNQDFAFHLELTSPEGAPWVLVGVADGVSQATWSSRAARHASAAFVEAVARSFALPAFPSTAAKLLRDDWSDVLTRSFFDCVQKRLDDDRRFLFAGRYLDPTWAHDVFRDKFWSGPDAHANIAREWFQTTLLAAALGPEGGFALFLGDGYARVERRYGDGRSEISPGLEPTAMISLGLTEAQVRAGIVRLAPKGATHLGVLLTTDGVSSSAAEAIAEALASVPVPLDPGPGPPLDRASFVASDACRRFLDRLAKSPSADRDNMSVAFAMRPLDPPGTR